MYWGFHELDLDTCIRLLYNYGHVRGVVQGPTKCSTVQRLIVYIWDKSPNLMTLIQFGYSRLIYQLSLTGWRPSSSINIRDILSQMFIIKSKTGS